VLAPSRSGHRLGAEVTSLNRVIVWVPFWFLEDDTRVIRLGEKAASNSTTEAISQRLAAGLSDYSDVEPN
jgi:hypothetical protein